MVKSELNKVSPLRIFENSIHGGLGKGNIGIIAAKHGIGKTAVLVHLAVDKLFRDRHVIHVSFSTKTDHIISWYEDIFGEIAKKRDLEDSMEIHDQLIKNRVIMNFNRDGVTPAKVLNSIKTMITEGHFAADAVMFEGLTSKHVSKEDIEEVRAFAKEMNLEVWYSVSPDKGEDSFDEYGVPSCLKVAVEDADVFLSLKSDGSQVHMYVLNDHGSVKEPKDLQLVLDPATMLVSRDPS